MLTRTQLIRIFSAANAIIRVHCELPGRLSKATHDQSQQLSPFILDGRSSFFTFVQPQTSRTNKFLQRACVISSFKETGNWGAQWHAVWEVSALMKIRCLVWDFCIFLWRQFIAPLEDGHFWVNAHFLLRNFRLNVMQRAKGRGSHYHNASDLLREGCLIKVSRFMLMLIAARWHIPLC